MHDYQINSNISVLKQNSTMVEHVQKQNKYVL